jgi:hypothetical protein
VVDPADIPLCGEFEATGACRGGDDCPLVHGDKCEVRGPRAREGRAARVQGRAGPVALGGGGRPLVARRAAFWRVERGPAGPPLQATGC